MDNDKTPYREIPDSFRKTNSGSPSSASVITKHASLPPSLITIILLMAGAFCCPMSAWTLFQGYLSYSDALFLAALVMHSTRLLTNPKAVNFSIFLLTSAVIIIISGLITSMIDSPASDPTNAAKLFFSMILLPVLIAIIVGADKAIIEKLLIAWLAGGVFNALVAYASSHGVSVFGFYDKAYAMTGRSMGLSYHSNALGYSAALLIPVTAYFWSRTSYLILHIILLMSLFLLLFALTSSGSRASLLALLFGLLPLINLIRRDRWPFIFLALLGLTLAALLFVSALVLFDFEMPAYFKESAISRLLGLTSSAAGSDIGRQSYIERSFALFFDAPLFGAGYWWLRGAHMHILGIMNAGGLFGLSGLILWWTAVFFAERRVSTSTSNRALWALVVSGLVVWLINGAMQPNLLDREGYLLIGILFALDNPNKRKIADTEINRPLEPSKRLL
jgi:O-antigen ligase